MITGHIDNFLNQLRVVRNASRLTLVSYRTDLEQYFQFIANRAGIPLGEVELTMIDHKSAREYLAELQRQGLQRSTMARKLAALRSFVKYLCRENILKNNPIAAVATPKQDKKLPNFLYPVEVVQLIEAPDLSKPLGIRDRALLEILYASGLRVAELVGMRLQDIDFREGLVKVRGKGDKERIVPLGENALKYLHNYFKVRQRLLDNNQQVTSAVFVNRFGKGLSARSVRNIINKYVEAIAINSHVTPHTLRHTFATHMLNNGADLRSVQELLGHVKLSTTQIYTHLTKENIKTVHNKSLPRR